MKQPAPNTPAAAILKKQPKYVNCKITQHLIFHISIHVNRIFVYCMAGIFRSGILFAVFVIDFLLQKINSRINVQCKTTYMYVTCRNRTCSTNYFCIIIQLHLHLRKFNPREKHPLHVYIRYVLDKNKGSLIIHVH